VMPPQAVSFLIRTTLDIYSIRDGKLYDFNLQRTVKDFTNFAEVAYAQVSAKEIPAGAPKPFHLALRVPWLIAIICIAPAAPVPAEQAVGAAAVEAEAGNAAKEVVILTEDNFDAETGSGDWLVELYRILHPLPEFRMRAILTC
jgi:hypothetical protein